MDGALEWCEGLTSGVSCKVEVKDLFRNFVIGSCNLLDDAPDGAPGTAPDSTPDTALTKAVWILYPFSAIAAT
ncbi:hypothetical protein V496_07176 [Pseudogymnoascus sp. VKM F-4515 (FW-2607)]|nr:hypothetical protein V496_07176 [Pseudogymnoascus sp. VKM F-4515 (FW-2607)]KFY97944.1 hypothetical protein V498_01772 [Pseudogymnoascus sp. VKM F-4517 (FW-2822)]